MSTDRSIFRPLAVRLLLGEIMFYWVQTLLRPVPITVGTMLGTGGSHDGDISIGGHRIMAGTHKCSDGSGPDRYLLQYKYSIAVIVSPLVAGCVAAGTIRTR
jgi:hypothetical protein